jgi:RecA-family ATPase
MNPQVQVTEFPGYTERCSAPEAQHTNGHASDPLPEEPPKLEGFFAEEYTAKPATPTKHVVENFILASAPNGFFGDGGTGKDLLSAMLGAARAFGKDWLGLPTQPGRTLYLPVEDSGDPTKDDTGELGRRLHAIEVHYGCKFADYGERFKIVPMRGRDTVLAAFDSKAGVVKTRPLFETLQREIEAFTPDVVILGNRVNIFGVNQNDDAQARQCITLVLDAICNEYGCAVIMPSHVSVAGLREGSGTSGTVQWSNGMRLRTYLRRIKDEKDQVIDPDLRELEVMKANWGPSGNIIRIRWQNGVFVPDVLGAGANSFQKLASDQRVEEVFLTLLARYRDQGREVSASPTANNYAPTMFSRDPGAVGIPKRAFADAMNRLFGNRKIRVEQYGRPSRPQSRLVTADEGVTHA